MMPSSDTRPVFRCSRSFMTRMAVASEPDAVEGNVQGRVHVHVQVNVNEKGPSALTPQVAEDDEDPHRDEGEPHRDVKATARLAGLGIRARLGECADQIAIAGAMRPQDAEEGVVIDA